MINSPLLFFSLILLLFASSSICQLVRLPLKKSRSQQPNLNKNLRNLAATDNTIPIKNNDFNSMYTITVQIGSNNQEFTLSLDTGSHILWIPDSSLSNQLPHTFDCAGSKTCRFYKNEITPLAYGKGYSEGYMITDQVHFGNLAIPKFNMVLSNAIKDFGMEKMDGILGLSLRSNNYNYPTVLDSLKKNKVINTRTFSMYLGSVSSFEDETTGELIFGGYDPQYCESDFQFVNVRYSSSIFWETQMSGISYGANNNIINTMNYPTIFDSGASLLGLPGDVINQIIATVEAKGVQLGYIKGEDLHTCFCNAVDKLDDLVFYFEGATFNIPPSSYIKPFGDGTCYFAMFPLEGLNFTAPIILGDVFLKNYYALYTADNYTVGLAKVRDIPVKYSDPTSFHIFIDVTFFLFVVALLWECYTQPSDLVAINKKGNQEIEVKYSDNERLRNIEMQSVPQEHEEGLPSVSQESRDNPENQV